MVKMNLEEVQIQTADIKVYCISLRKGAENLTTVASALGLEIGISGATGNSIKSYIASMYPALSRTMILHADSVEEANQAYVAGYVSMCGGASLDSEVLERQIRGYDMVISDLESSKASQESWYRSLDSKMQGLIWHEHQEIIRSLNSSISTNKTERRTLQEKLERLLAFNAQSPSYFSGTEESKNLLNEGLQLLGGDLSTGSIGPGSWNGQGFTKLKSDWQRRVNEKWVDVHGTENEKFAQNLKKQYGFDQETITVIIKLKDQIDKMKLPQSEKDYLFNRLLGGLSYGSEGFVDNFNWSHTAGLGMTGRLSIEGQLKVLLNTEEYNLLKYKIRIQNQISSNGDKFFWNNLETDEIKKYKNSMEKALGRGLTKKEFENLWKMQFENMKNKTDYSHQSITTATNLLKKPRVLDLAMRGHENVNNLSGWKGDATLKGDDGKVSFGSDDYRADLDAENIAYLMKKDQLSFAQASNKYYGEVGVKYTRSELFLEHEDFQDVKKQILKDLNSKTMSELHKQQPDAYQFIKNLENKTNELRDF